jgi:ribosomal protein L22
MTDEPDKNAPEPEPASTEASDDTALASANVQEEPGTRVSSQTSADAVAADAPSAEAEEAEQAEVESGATSAEAESEATGTGTTAAGAQAGSEPEAAVDDDDDELPPTDDEPVPLEEDDESPVVEPDGEIGEEEAEEAEAGETRPARPRRTGSSRSRARVQRDPDLPPPVVRAHAKYVRSSARKARLVCDQFRGRSVEEARAILAVTPRAIARDWSKLLESAVANAEHNHELVGEDLYVKAAHADEGPTIKRYQPRAKGRATRIRKRTSHLTILLTPKD